MLIALTISVFWDGPTSHELPELRLLSLKTTHRLDGPSICFHLNAVYEYAEHWLPFPRRSIF